MTDEVSASSGHTRGFLFADLRGYTDFVERRGDDAAAALLERYRTLVRGVVARHAGAEVKTEGDSFYVLFPSASSAVAAGLDIVAGAAGDSAEHPDAPIRVGVGVHAGETSDLPEGPVGSAVNMAARICAQAGAGEVLVSDTVRGLTRTRNVAVFGSVGSRRLKGIAEPVLLYRAAPPGTVISGSRRRAGGRSVPLPWVALGALAVLVAVPLAFYVFGRPGDAGASPTPAVSSPSPTAQSAASPTAATSPSAAPVTGSRIIFSRQVNEEGACSQFPLDAKLHVLDPDHLDVAPYRLTYASNLIEMDPGWSLDGATVAFIGGLGAGPGGINKVDISGDRLVTLAPPRAVEGVNLIDGGGNRLLVVGDAVVHLDLNGIYMTPLEGGPTMPILRTSEVPEIEPTEQFLDAAATVDGKILLLGRSVDGASSWLETVSMAGEREPAEFDMGDFEEPSSIALAGDGDTMAIGSAANAHLWVGKLSEGPADFRAITVSDLIDPQGLVFAPEGDRIAMWAGRPGGQQLVIVELASGEATFVENAAGTIACRPAWRSAPPNMLTGAREPEPGQPRPFELGLLEPGEYLNDVVDPALTLTFTDGWVARRSYVDGWSVVRLGAQGEVDSARLQVGSAQACQDEEHPDTVRLDPGPGNVADFVEGRADLVSTQASPINLGGYTGLAMTVSGKAGKGCTFGDGEEFWSFAGTGEDRFSLAPGESLRLMSIDVRGTTVSFLIFTDEDLDAYYATHALPLLQTLTFPDE